MAETTIEWTERTWNPIVGCSIVSPGCTNCYAMGIADRFKDVYLGRKWAGMPAEAMTRRVNGKAVWTGHLTLAPDHILTEPLRRRKPTTYFVNSMGDLFHEDTPEEWIDLVIAIMALCPQHTFQILTKRGERMRTYMGERTELLSSPNEEGGGPIARAVISLAERESRSIAVALSHINPTAGRWPLPNVWLGVSAEDQKRADERIAELLATPAAVRFVSAEPLLGPIDFRQWQHSYGCGCGWGGDSPLDYCTSCGWRGRALENESSEIHCHDCGEALSDYNACPECDGHDGDGMSFGPNSKPPLDWIIVGGESGPGARPMHPDWSRQIRDQCAAAGTAFFFKQWGEWLPDDMPSETAEDLELRNRYAAIGDQQFSRAGKKAAGRLLDGVEHNAMPGR